MEKFALFIDAGHGGCDAQGRYLTPGKRAKHPGHTFHDGSWFYEGVSNRIYAEEFSKMCEAAGIKVIKTYHPYLDISLTDRAKQVNRFVPNFERSLLLSFHSNALQGRSRGFSVWTTFGQTNSDKVATDIIRFYKEEVPKGKVLEDNRDRDPDFENDFYILKAVKCPAVLMEYLFFDNPYDAEIIFRDAEAKAGYLRALLRAVLLYATGSDKLPAAPPVTPVA